MTKDLTRGSPTKMIITFCLPLMIGQFFQQFYNMVDSIVVGRFAGTAELSAVGSTGSLGFMVIGFATGICSGFAIPVSQSFGAGNHKKMRRFMVNALYLTLATAAVLTAITMLATRPLLEIMNTPDDIIDMAYTYISTIFAGLVATMIYNFTACIMRAVGDSRTPLYLLIFSSLLNVALDMLFVIRLGMAVKGVAIATVIAQSVSAVLGVIIIRKKFTILRVEPDERKLDWHLCGRLLYIGVPMALQFSVTAVGSVMLQSAVNQLGSTVIAAVTVASKIQLMVILPAETIGATMATYCGQNIGAEQVGRIRQGMNRAILISIVYCAISICAVWLMGGRLALLFVKGNQTAVIDCVVRFLRTCSGFYPVLGVLFIYRNAIQGMGYSIPAMLAGVFELAARAAMGFLVIPAFGYPAVCFANPAAWVAADVLLIPVYYYIYRMMKRRFPPKGSDCSQSGRRAADKAE